MPPTAQVKTRYPQNNLAACMLPWTEDFQLDVAKFEQHVQATLDDGYKCLYLMGTAGEGYALNDTRFKQVVDLFAAMTVREGLIRKSASSDYSMEQIIERIAYAHARGIRMFQISLPSWGALDEAETMIFFKTVCGAFPDSRFLHYNLPRQADHRRPRIPSPGRGSAESGCHQEQYDRLCAHGGLDAELLRNCSTF